MAAATLASATQVASASASRAPSDAAWSGGVDRDRLTRLQSWPQQGMGRRTARESVQGRGVPPSVSRHQLKVSVGGVRDVPGGGERGWPVHRLSLVSLRFRGDGERRDEGGEVPPALAVGCPAVGPLSLLIWATARARATRLAAESTPCVRRARAPLVFVSPHRLPSLAPFSPVGALASESAERSPRRSGERCREG